MVQLRTPRAKAVMALLIVVFGALFLVSLSLSSGFGLVMEIGTSLDYQIYQGKNEITQLSVTNHRKLLQQKENSGVVLQNDISSVEKCSPKAIKVDQAPTTSTLPSGIPEFRVRIKNTCRSGCNISNIHLSCGWFNSAHMIDPRMFKRIAFDDCLVNDGKPLLSGRMIDFRYSNTHPYPLSVSSLLC